MGRTDKVITQGGGGELCGHQGNCSGQREELD